LEGGEMKIRKITIEIKPWEIPFAKGQRYELRINVITDTENYDKTEIMFEDDLESRFDLYFDYAKREMKEVIRKKLKDKHD